MRLCEMGFPADQVGAALQANNGNEEAALNSLLSGPVVTTNTAGAAGAPGAPSTGGDGATGGPDKPVKPSGLFGRMWGSK